MPPQPRSPEFRAGLRAAVPLLVAVGPFGLVTGVAMAAGGIPPLEGMAMSVLVYAGASMLAATQLFVDGAPAFLIVLAAFFVNLRLLMYSASMRPHLIGAPLHRKLVVSYMLVDNPYALFIGRYGGQGGTPAYAPGKFDFFFGVGIPIWIGWQATVLAGLLVGAQLPPAWKLDFAAPLAFIAMSVPLLRDKATVAAAVCAGATAILAHGLPLRLGLALAALAGIAAGLLAERLAQARA